MAEYDFLAPALKNALASKNLKKKLNPFADSVSASATQADTSAPSLSEAMSAPSGFKQAVTKEPSKRLSEMSFADVAKTAANAGKEFATERLAGAMEKSPALSKSVDVAASGIGAVKEGLLSVTNISPRAQANADKINDAIERGSISDIAKESALALVENGTKGGLDVVTSAINATPAGAAMNALISGGLTAINQKENFDEAIGGLDNMFTALGKKLDMSDEHAQKFGSSLSAAAQILPAVLGYKYGASKISNARSVAQNAGSASVDVLANTAPALIGGAYNLATGTEQGPDKVGKLLGVALTAGAVNTIAGPTSEIGRAMRESHKGATGKVPLETKSKSDVAIPEDSLVGMAQDAANVATGTKNRVMSKEEWIANLGEEKGNAKIAELEAQGKTIPNTKAESEAAMVEVPKEQVIPQEVKVQSDNVVTLNDGSTVTKKLASQTPEILRSLGRPEEQIKLIMESTGRKYVEPKGAKAKKQETFVPEPEVPKQKKEQPILFAKEKPAEVVAASRKKKESVTEVQKVETPASVTDAPKMETPAIATDVIEPKKTSEANKEAWAQKRAEEEAARKQAAAEKRMTAQEASKQRKEANRIAREQDAANRKLAIAERASARAQAKLEAKKDNEIENQVATENVTATVEEPKQKSLDIENLSEYPFDKKIDVSYDDIASYGESMGGTSLEGKTNAWKQSRYDALMKAFKENGEEQAFRVRLTKNPNTGKYEIDSGNHRFEVLKELGLPIKAYDAVTKEDVLISPKKEETQNTISETTEVAPVIETPAPLTEAEIGTGDVFANIEEAVKAKKEGRKPRTPEQIAFVNPEMKTLHDELKQNELEGKTFEVSGIPEMLNAIQGVNKVNSWLTNTALDIRSKLNQINVTFGDGISRGLGTVVQGIQGRKQQMMETAKRALQFEELESKATENADEINSTFDNLMSGKNDSAWFGKDPQGFMKDVVLGGYEHLLEKTKYGVSDTLAKLSPIVDAVQYAKLRQGRDVLPMLPENLRNAVSEIVAKYDAANALEQTGTTKGSVEETLTGMVGEMLKQDKDLRKLNENYVRGVVSRRIRSNPHVTESMLSSMEESQLADLVDSGFIKTDKDGSMISDVKALPKYVASILKSSKDMVGLHSHSPILRMLDYADVETKLATDRKVLETLVSAMNADASTKKLLPFMVESGKNSYGRPVLTDGPMKVMMKKLIGTYDKAQSSGFMDKSVKFLVPASMIGNIKGLLMNSVGTVGRLSTGYLGNVLGSAVDRVAFNKPFIGFGVKGYSSALEAVRLLGETGFATNGNKFQHAIKEATNLFVGERGDNVAKGIIAAQYMTRVVGEVPEGKTLGQAFFEKLSGMEKDKSLKILADLSDKVTSVSDFSYTAKRVNSGLFGPVQDLFKSFNASTLGRYYDSVHQTADTVAHMMLRDKKFSKEIGIDNLKKISSLSAFTIMNAYALNLMVQGLIGAISPDASEDEKKEMAKQFAPPITEQLMNSLFAYFSPTVASMVLRQAKGMAEVITDTVAGKNITLNDALKASQIFAVSRDLANYLSTTKEFGEPVTSARGNYEYSNVGEDAWKVMLGLGETKAAYNVALDKIQDKGEKDFYSNARQLLGDAIYRSIKAPMQDLDSFTKLGTRYDATKSRANFSQVLDNIEEGKNVTMSTDEWIRNAFRLLEVNTDGKTVSTFLDSANASSESERKKLMNLVEGIRGAYPIPYTGDMNAYMEELRTKNPSEFANVLSTLANAVTLVTAGDDMKGLKSMSTSNRGYVDAEIKSRYEDVPLMYSELARRLSEQMKDKDVNDPNVLNMLDQLTAASMENPRLKSQLYDSISEAVATSLKKGENLNWHTLDGYDNLKDSVVTALKNRGMIFENEDTGEIEPVEEEVKPKTSPVTAPTVPTFANTAGGIADKNAPVLNLKKILGQAKESKMQFATPQLSGADKLAKLFDMTKGIQVSK